MNEKDNKGKFEDIKKTAEAHGTVSEEAAKKEAEGTEKVTGKIIDETNKKEEKEAVEKFESEETKEKSRDTKKKRYEENTTEVWEPKTRLGEEVKSGKIKDIEEVLSNKRKILESEVVDSLLEGIKTDLISVGQSKGKFGGGKRRAWRQTQRKTKEGNIPTFSAMAVAGDGNGHVGIGYGRSKETLPARDKAIRKAKINLIKVGRACADFDCSCNELHSIPFKVSGKSGSVRVTLIPAAQGTGLVVANELKKILQMAGIKDVYSKTFGKKRTTFNLIKACVGALEKTNEK